MKVLYFDCFSGISGDMTLGALIDLVGESDILTENIKKLKLTEPYEINITKKKKNGITGTDVEILTDKGHHHRHLEDIISIINQSSLDDDIKETSRNIFTRLARAEAKVHNLPVEKIHFHEVGATDAIIDIVGSAILLHHIGADLILSSPLHDGHGFVSCAHGMIPVPVPAVVEIAAGRGAKIGITDNEGEMITPTGAAIICETAKSFTRIKSSQITGVGYGLGKKDFDRPNMLRVFLFEEEKDCCKYVVETNIDDTTGEILGYTMERLMENGALDVWFTPIYMKKNRPGYTLSFLANAGDRERLKDIVFQETSALGIREYPTDRIELTRKIVAKETDLGTLKVKQSIFRGNVQESVEFESARELALKNNIPLKNFY